MGGRARTRLTDQVANCNLLPVWCRATALQNATTWRLSDGAPWQVLTSSRSPSSWPASTCSSSTSRSRTSGATSPAGLAELSWVLNAYAIVFAALLVPAGGSPTARAQRVFVGGLLLFVAGLGAVRARALGSRCSSPRASIQAAGAALLLPTSLALLLPEFPAEQRAAAIGIWAAVGGVAAAARAADRRPAGRGAAGAGSSWSTCRVGLVAFVYAVRLLRESRDPTATGGPTSRRGDPHRRVGALALGIVKAPDWGWGDARTSPSSPASLAGLARRSGAAACPTPRRSSTRRCCGCAPTRWRARRAAVLGGLRGDAARQRAVHDRRLGRLGPASPGCRSRPAR